MTLTCGLLDALLSREGALKPPWATSLKGISTSKRLASFLTTNSSFGSANEMTEPDLHQIAPTVSICSTQKLLSAPQGCRDQMAYHRRMRKHYWYVTCACIVGTLLTFQHDLSALLDGHSEMRL